MQDELLAMDDTWTLRDHLNTVRKVLDMKGKIVSHLEYDAFGKLLNATGDKPLFRYTGKMFDEAAGLQWNINRWYDANVGRWISEDPIGFEGEDDNLYRYGSNDFVNAFDYNGLWIIRTACCCTCAALSGWKVIKAWWEGTCLGESTEAGFALCLIQKIIDFSPMMSSVACVSLCANEEDKVQCIKDCLNEQLLDLLIDVTQMATCACCLGLALMEQVAKELQKIQRPIRLPAGA